MYLGHHSPRRTLIKKVVAYSEWTTPPQFSSSFSARYSPNSSISSSSSTGSNPRASISGPNASSPVSPSPSGSKVANSVATKALIESISGAFATSHSCRETKPSYISWGIPSPPWSRLPPLPPWVIAYAVSTNSAIAKIYFIININYKSFKSLEFIHYASTIYLASNTSKNDIQAISIRNFNGKYEELK